jgi:hypothetical protein
MKLLFILPLVNQIFLSLLLSQISSMSIDLGCLTNFQTSLKHRD